MKINYMPELLVVAIYIGSAMVEETVPNNVIFEKVEYQIFNKTLIKDGIIKWKKVGYNTLVFNASMTLTEPMTEIWIHIVLYYKYRHYEKYLVDLWIEYCRSIQDPDNHPLARLVFNNFISLRDHFDINFDMLCPLSGDLKFNTNRPFNVSKIALPLMKAGRYRANLYCSPIQNGPVYIAGQAFFSISDLRLWF